MQAIEFDFISPLRSIRQFGDRKAIHRLDESRRLLRQCPLVWHGTQCMPGGESHRTDDVEGTEQKMRKMRDTHDRQAIPQGLNLNFLYVDAG